MAHWLLIALAGVANMMETITFMQFIEEEAIQSASLGVFLALRSKSYKGASLGMSLLRRDLIPHLREINDEVGMFAPYSKRCFEDFINATEMNLDIYDGIMMLHI